MGVVRRYIQKRRSRHEGKVQTEHRPDALANGDPVDPFCDWAWRPDIFDVQMPAETMPLLSQGRPISSQCKMFFDGPKAKGEGAQTQNTGPLWHAPYGFRFAFRNIETFVSVVFDLPKSSVTGLHKHTVYQCDLIAEIEWVSAIYMRLNIKHGANVAQYTEKCHMADDAMRVEFDLGFSDFEENRITGAWLDVVFETHGAPGVRMRDLTIMRCPRGQF